MRPTPSPPPTQVTGSSSIAALGFARIGDRRFDFSDPYHVTLTVGWPLFTLGIATLYGVVNLIFAGLYLASPGSIENATPGSFSDAFFFSMETLATVGYGQMHPATLYGHWVSGLEIAVGMAFTAIATGLIFVRFSKPRARIHYAEQVVVSTYNGKPTLMIRIGNGRPNILNDMRPRITALVKETTLENHSFRKSHDLKLVQTWYAIFALTLTIMHVIDETSPLYGMDRQAMIEGEVRLFLSLEARDPALSSLVHDLHPYEAEKIFFGMRYAETIRRDPEGRSYVDHDLLGVIEPDSI